MHDCNASKVHEQAGITGMAYNVIGCASDEFMVWPQRYFICEKVSQDLVGPVPNVGSGKRQQGANDERERDGL